MTWKAIGHSVIGTSHTTTGKPCEDAIQYHALPDANGDEVLICCASDGAGSAQYAAWAAEFATDEMIEALTHFIAYGGQVTEADIYAMVEQIYDGLLSESETQHVELNEYSCTLLGCVISCDRAVFFQVGDGAIIRNDGSDFYTPVWWPHNGEYHNTTSFIVDDRSLSHLNILILEEEVNEVALFSDGMQMLALNMDTLTAHQPFFEDMFRFLRQANEPDKVTMLNRQLAEYLNSKQINDRTDDDKTLFLASRFTS